MYPIDSLISWKCERVSQSSTEAEYKAMSSAYSEILWLRGLLSNIGFAQSSHTSLHADNTRAIKIIENHFHECTKHIEVDCHFIRDEFKRDVISLPQVPTELRFGYIFTKRLPRPRHQFLVTKLLLCDSPASI